MEFETYQNFIICSKTEHNGLRQDINEEIKHAIPKLKFNNIVIKEKQDYVIDIHDEPNNYILFQDVDEITIAVCEFEYYGAERDIVDDIIFGGEPI